MNQPYPSARAGHIFLTNYERDESVLIGGHGADGPYDDVWSFINGQWNILYSIDTSSHMESPFPRYESGGCILSGDVFVFGGMAIDDASVSIFNDLWRFTLSSTTMRWLQVYEETPVAERSGHIVQSVHNMMIIHGGECNGRQYDDLIAFDLDMKAWLPLTIAGLKPQKRSNHASAVSRDSNMLVLFGGLLKTQDEEGNDLINYLNDAWLLDCSNADVNKWSWILVVATDLAPSPRDMPAILFHETSIILFGGFGLIEVEGSDISDGSCNEEWIEAEEGENQLENSSIADESNSNSNDEIREKQEYLNDIWIVDVINGVYETVSPSSTGFALPPKARGAVLLQLDDDIFGFGGYDGNTDAFHTLYPILPLPR